MEFITNLDVSCEEIFECLNQNIINDVKAFTGRTITADQIGKGFMYKKDINMNKSHPNWATVEVLEYNKPINYTIKYQSNKKSTVVTYRIKKIDDYKIELNYRECLSLKKKNSNNQYEIIEISNKKVKKVPFLKKIQLKELVKSIKKNRKSKKSKIN